MPSPDSDLFEQFVAGRRPALLRTAFLITGHAEDAEDLVQTTLIKVVPKWGRIKDNPEAYVRKVLAREATTRWRTRRWRETVVEHLPDRAAPGPDLTSSVAPFGTRCCGSRLGSVPSSSCVSTTTSPSARPRPRSASRSAPSSRRPAKRSLGSAR